MRPVGTTRARRRVFTLARTFPAIVMAVTLSSTSNANPASDSIDLSQANVHLLNATSPRDEQKARAEIERLFRVRTEPFGAAKLDDLGAMLRGVQDDTGMRDALNTAFRIDAAGIVTHALASSGTALDSDGRRALAGYGRVLFAADTGATGAHAADVADGNVRRLLTRLLSDIILARRDDGTRLEKDFGAHTFGSAEARDGNAAEALGFIITTFRSAADDLQSSAMQPTQAQYTSQKQRIEVLDALARMAGSALARDRPNENLANRFDDGRTRSFAAYHRSES